MDATNVYPRGFHPVWSRYLHDVSTRATVIPRSMVEVKYYFVDYGISSYFPPGSQSRLVFGTEGRDQDVPELSDDVPYDPFKVDIFTIGNVFQQLFCDVCLFTHSNPVLLIDCYPVIFQLRFLPTPHRIYDAGHS